MAANQEAFAFAMKKEEARVAFEKVIHADGKNPKARIADALELIAWPRLN
jgi:hypothetical protein